MSINSSKKAMSVALGQTRNVPGMCQKVTREWYNAPSAGDVDGDGDADAVDGWLKEPVSARHPGDRFPPAGKPLAFKGGGKGHGHRAMSLPNGQVRSTDMSGSSFKSGYVGTTTISAIERAMGVQYLGWSETIDGYKIPADEAAKLPAPVKPNPKHLFTTRVSTLNLMSLPKNPRLNKTLDSVTGIELVGFQEADPTSFKTTLKKRYPAIIQLGGLNDTTYAAPIKAIANIFTNVKNGTRKMYDGKKGVSYTRRLSWAHLTHKKSKTQFGIINLHAIVVKNDANRAFRVASREKCKAALKLQIAYFQKLGLPIIVTGDFNDKTSWLGSAIGGQRVQRVTHGIDQIYVIDCAKSKWSIERTVLTDTPSDHHTLRARVSLSLR